MLLKKIRKLRSADNQYWMLIALFFVLPIFFSGISMAVFDQGIDVFVNSKMGMVLFYFIAVAAMSMALIPSTFVAIISGWLFGWPGLAAMIPSYMMASILGVMLGKFLNNKITGNKHFENPMINDYNRLFANAQFSLMFFLRLSPLLTFASVNMAVSRMKINWVPFLLGTLIGMLPRTFLFFLAGMQAASIKEALENSHSLGTKALLFSVFLLLSVVGLIFVFIRLTKKQAAKIESKLYDQN